MQMIRDLLEGCSNIENYIDDILEHTVTCEKYLGVLRDLFIRIC